MIGPLLQIGLPGATEMIIVLLNLVLFGALIAGGALLIRRFSGGDEERVRELEERVEELEGEANGEASERSRSE